MTHISKMQVMGRCTRCDKLCSADITPKPDGTVKDTFQALDLHRTTLLMIKSNKVIDMDIRKDPTFNKRATGTLCGACHQEIIEGAHILATCAEEMMKGRKLKLYENFNKADDNVVGLLVTKKKGD